jgi:Dimethlysulfonioproprionate lyase
MRFMPFEELLTSTRSFLEERDNPRVDDFLAGLDWKMAERTLPPRALPCLAHLDRCAFDTGANERRLVRLIAENRQSFHWGQTYKADDFGSDFLDKYGWIELFGTRGHFRNDMLAAGFLLLGPHLEYPDHHHIAEEIYVPLTGGSEWRMGNRPFAVRGTGTVIHHASNVSHAMRTGEHPLLALYLWRGGPLDQKSTIGASAVKS